MWPCYSGEDEGERWSIRGSDWCRYSLWSYRRKVKTSSSKDWWKASVEAKETHEDELIASVMSASFWRRWIIQSGLGGQIGAVYRRDICEMNQVDQRLKGKYRGEVESVLDERRAECQLLLTLHPAIFLHLSTFLLCDLYWAMWMRLKWTRIWPLCRCWTTTFCGWRGQTRREDRRNLWQLFFDLEPLALSKMPPKGEWQRHRKFKEQQEADCKDQNRSKKLLLLSNWLFVWLLGLILTISLSLSLFLFSPLNLSWLSNEFLHSRLNKKGSISITVDIQTQSVYFNFCFHFLSNQTQDQSSSLDCRTRIQIHK